MPEARLGDRVGERDGLRVASVKCHVLADSARPVDDELDGSAERFVRAILGARADETGGVRRWLADEPEVVAEDPRAELEAHAAGDAYRRQTRRPVPAEAHLGFAYVEAFPRFVPVRESFSGAPYRGRHAGFEGDGQAVFSRDERFAHVDEQALELVFVFGEQLAVQKYAGERVQRV